jgi:hypothetical protein
MSANTPFASNEVLRSTRTPPQHILTGFVFLLWHTQDYFGSKRQTGRLASRQISRQLSQTLVVSPYDCFSGVAKKCSLAR